MTQLPLTMQKFEPEFPVHFTDLFGDDGVNVLLRREAEVQLRPGHEVVGEPVGERREETRAEKVRRQESHRRRFVGLKLTNLVISFNFCEELFSDYRIQ
jgi:hypothetical protein